VPIARAPLVCVIVALACNRVDRESVAQAERAVDDAQKQVEDGLRNAQDRAVAVEQDLGKAAERVQKRVEEVGKDAIPAPTDEEVAGLVRDAPAAISCDEHSCTVARSVADRLRAKPAAFATQAHVVPEQRDGRVIGLRLSEVKELPRLLGFRERDVIVSINGLRLQSLQNVPQLFLQLQSATRFTVEYERAGERATKVIAIV
jgi:type II secretion system protein C